jgi:hypothetical protein
VNSGFLNVNSSQAGHWVQGDTRIAFKKHRHTRRPLSWERFVRLVVCRRADHHTLKEARLDEAVRRIKSYLEKL